MILSSRPTDRRQLIEEAAGVTKYKSRRRAAELKLDAAQQNLTRLDDIVFEVEKQCGSLKRQAAKARRYQRLRDEMRRWEKVLFARRYRHLAEHIESARARLHDARQDEVASTRAARRGGNRTGPGAASNWPRPSRTRRRARGRSRARARGEPPPAAARARRPAGGDARDPRRRARSRAADARGAARARASPPRRAARRHRRSRARPATRRPLPACGRRPRRSPPRSRPSTPPTRTSNRPAARCYAVINTITALTTAIEHAAAERERTAAVLGRLEVEAARSARPSSDAPSRPRDRATSRCGRPQSGAGTTDAGLEGRARSANWRTARSEHEWRERREAPARTRPGRADRPAAVARRDGRRARRVRRRRADAAGRAPTRPWGSAARWPTTSRCSRATNARSKPRSATCSSTSWSTATPRRTPASQLVRSRGRRTLRVHRRSSDAVRPGRRRRRCRRCRQAASRVDVVRVTGPFAPALRGVVGEAVDHRVASTPRPRSAGAAGVPVVTTRGRRLSRRPRGQRRQPRPSPRGILATKREIRDLRERGRAGRAGDCGAGGRPGRLRAGDRHGQRRRDGPRWPTATARKRRSCRPRPTWRGPPPTRRGCASGPSSWRPRPAARARRSSDLDARQADAQAHDRPAGGRARHARDGAGRRQRQLARRPRRAHDPEPDVPPRRAPCTPGWSSARWSAVAEVQRLEEAARELSERADACRRDMELMREQRARLLDGVRREPAAARRQHHARSTALRDEMAEADDETLVLKAATDRQEQSIRDARRALDAVRALAAELDVSRATGEAELDAPGAAEPRRGAGGSRHRGRRSGRDGAPGHPRARRPA